MGTPLRRYFDGLLLLLLATGFFTLASTGRLAWPIVVAAGSAYAVRCYGFLRRRSLTVPNRVWLAGLLLYLPVYAGDALLWSHSLLQATLHLVVLAGAGKLLAPESGRDTLLLGLLAFLEVLTAALLTVSGLFFVLFLLFLVLLVATLVAQEMARAEAQRAAPGGGSPLRPLFRFSLLLSLGVALSSVVIFFLLPRTGMGVWAARPAARGLTGFSDEVRLGAIASLERSDTPVMHIRLVSSDPPLTPAQFQQIRWRGRGLTHFDGQRWTSDSTPGLYGTQAGRLDVSRYSAGSPPELVRYQVTLEPMNSPVLFFPAQLLRASTHFPVLAWDRATGTLASLGADFAGTSYAGVSDLAQPSPQALRRDPRARVRFRFGFQAYLQLPRGLDPRIPLLARSIVAHAPGDDWDRMQALSGYLQTHYQYTLEDLPQGADPLAEFLFDQQAGDCEYFASALAVMARTLGIPTRVVNGFVVDAYNPLSGEYVVRGRDAHSWVEAYFPGERRGRGFQPGTWMSFDATPAGASAAAAGWGGGMVLDALSSLWQEWIVNYDWLRQARLAEGVETRVAESVARAWSQGGAAASAAWRQLGAGGGAGAKGWAEGAAGLVLLGGLGLAGWTVRRRGWWRAGPGAAAEEEAAARRARRAYRRFQRTLRRAGFAPRPAQTSEELLGEVAAARPRSPLLAAATAFVAAYQAVRYGAASPPATHDLGRLLAQVRRCR
ncbi:MAG TPA: DUF3488 and transglutaminase-like domain-containing protein [Terriglobales bacterium]|nr:DUF3488 and transglutaminase-like domain-containing protein [Terriglobales bacterium]